MKKVVLAVGQFVPRKGYDILLQAWKQCDQNNELWIIGDEITEEMLLSRDDSNVIIEHIHGICMDEEGNGRVLNTDSEYDYIAYNGFSCTASVEIGDIVDTYLIYDPACQAPDCIIERRDFIVYHSEDAAIETEELEALYGKTEEN